MMYFNVLNDAVLAYMKFATYVCVFELFRALLIKYIVNTILRLFSNTFSAII